MMMTLIRPTHPDLRVRQPDGALLPATGATVPWDTFWERRLTEGAIERVPDPDPRTPKPRTPNPEPRTPTAD